MLYCRSMLTAALLGFLLSSAVQAQEKPTVGLIPKAQKAIKLDGKLDDWEGAFVTPVHVGHPDFANRGGEFLYLWDDKDLYIGLRCLDQTPAHVAPDKAIFSGDAVEFYLDVRRGEMLGNKDFGTGSLHMFWTPFTKTEIKPRMSVREIPAFKDFKLQGAELAAEKTPWGWTAEFKLSWANFPGFTPKAGEIIGIDCELCSSDGAARVDRTFVYSGPAAVASPSAFGRVKLVDKIEPESLKPLGRVLLPLALTRAANYPVVYASVLLSPTIEKQVVKIEGKLKDSGGKAKKLASEVRKTLDGGFVTWTGRWELIDLPEGIYTLELSALDKEGKIVTSRAEKVLHGNAGENTGTRIDPPAIDNVPRLGVRFYRDKKPLGPIMRFGLVMEGVKDPGSNKTMRPGGFKCLTFSEFGISNNTCLRVDGKAFLFGDSTGRWKNIEKPIKDDKGVERGLESVWVLDASKIEVTQHVEIVRGQTELLDTCLIAYRIENKDTVVHKVGLRFLLDTFIGGNDGVPFTLPGIKGFCNTMHDFSDPKNISDFIQVLENSNSDDPGTVAHLQLRVGELEAPDRVSLGAWPNRELNMKLWLDALRKDSVPDSVLDKLKSNTIKENGAKLYEFPFENQARYLDQMRRNLVDPLTPEEFAAIKNDLANESDFLVKPRCIEYMTLWDVPVVSMKSINEWDGKSAADSAVTIYWSEKNLDPGMHRDVGFTYGLGKVSKTSPVGKFSLTVGGNLRMPNPEFSLTAYVPAPDPNGQNLTLVLPNGCKLTEGEMTQKVPKVESDAGPPISTVTWMLTGEENKTYDIKVRSTTGGEQSIEVKIKPRRPIFE